MPSAANLNDLASFQQKLIGTWSNITLPHSTTNEGSPSNPLSFNVMPLPAPTDIYPRGYILKNFKLYENITFDPATQNLQSTPVGPPPTTAPNRGPSTQLPTALYYQQQVFFAEGPGVNTVVHTENGSWLNLVSGDLMVYPYAAATPSSPNTQPASHTIAKQMSVPHGNSIIALGTVDTGNGAPTIPDSSSVLPVHAGINTDVYKTETTGNPSDPPETIDYENPNPEWTLNPNLPLQTAVMRINPTGYIHWQVTTDEIETDVKGDVINIPFENRYANVTGYSADYWLMTTDGTNYDYLAYSQVINMQVTIEGITDGPVLFPHVTTNVLTRDQTSTIAPVVETGVPGPYGKGGHGGKGRHHHK